MPGQVGLQIFVVAFFIAAATGAELQQIDDTSPAMNSKRIGMFVNGRQAPGEVDRVRR